MFVDFNGINLSGKELHFRIELPKEIEQELPKNQKLNEDFNLTLKRIVLDTINLTKDILDSRINIKLCNYDKTNDSISYEIENEPKQPLHTLRLPITNKKDVIDRIAKRHIFSEDISKQAPDLNSILEHFSASEKQPTTILGKLMQILANFFNMIRENFLFIDIIWEAITHESAIKLKWDLKVLSEVCGAPGVESMTMYQALRYMSKMLDRERTEAADPALTRRVKDAYLRAKQIKVLKEHFNAKRFNYTVQKLQKSISEIKGDKVLIPVGYVDKINENEKLNEMLLEVSKDQSTGKFTAALISTSAGTRELFDRQNGIKTGTQSMRREISNISENDLLAAIPMLVELQTSPPCLHTTDSHEWQNIFMQTLRFDNSVVSVGKYTEPYQIDLGAGHLGEAVTYLGAEHKTPEEAKRFELGLRLRFFTDVIKREKKGIRNKEFWVLARTTARQMTTMIEEDKSILGSTSAQGVELTKIYYELRGILDKLDSTLPEFVDLRRERIPLFAGSIDVHYEKTIPKLPPLPFEKNVYPVVEPPLVSFNHDEPLKTLSVWFLRCRQLMNLNEYDLAAQEAHLMVRMLPPLRDPVWSKFSVEESKKVMEAFKTIGEAIARTAVNKSPPTLQDIASSVALTYYSGFIARNAWKINQEMIDVFLVQSQRALADLMKSRISLHDKHWLSEIFSVYGEVEDYRSKLERLLKENGSLPLELNPLLDSTQFMAMTLGLYNMPSMTDLPTQPLNFQINSQLNIFLMGSQKWNSKFISDYKTPLNFLAPDYAKVLTEEVTNRYLTEFCPLGCINDNCPNYNKEPKEVHRFHPLYMLHNYADLYCPKLMKEGRLYRDEVTDLMYTQQTNVSANKLFMNYHDGMHGFPFTKGFNESDLGYQLMNTISLFFEHPHFFKQPDLRWLFENKLFGNNSTGKITKGALSSLLKNAVYNQNRPFLFSMLSKFMKEIQVSKSSGDLDITAYLVNIVDEIQQTIQMAHIQQDEIDLLLSKIPIKADDFIYKLSQDIVGKTDEGSREMQKTVLSLLLSRYYKKFCIDSNDPCFSSDKDLEIMLCAIGRLESMIRGNEKIDPEIREQYQNLISWIAPILKGRIAKDKVQGDFVNKILFILDPVIASMRLKWDPVDFPTLIALDKKGRYYQFDLFTGKMSFGQNRIEQVPQNIRDDKNFQKIFGTALNENWVVSGTPKEVVPGAIAYTNVKFPNMRIIIRKGDEKIGSKRSKITLERVIDSNTVFQKQVLTTYLRFNEQDRVLSNEQISKACDIPPGLALCIGDRNCWLDSQNQRIYVYEADNKTLFATINLKGKETKITIDDVHFAQEDVHLLRPEAEQLDAFSSIEKPQFIQTTGKSRHPSTITFQRYELASNGAPLVYELTKKGIVSKPFPGYELAPFGARPGKRDPAIGVVPLPETFDNFQLLKKDGDEKVLIPLREIEQQFSVEGEKLPLSKMLFPDDYSKCQLYEYTVDPETNRLKAKEGDAYAYLAYVCVTNWDYASALYYLNKAVNSTGYENNYDKIFHLMEQIRDDSPNGTAFNLHFEIFREMVLEDRRIRFIAEGKLSGMESLDIQRTQRLSHIADMYAKYSNAIAERNNGRKTIDPTLDLSLKEEEYVLFLIKELINQHGDQTIDHIQPNVERAKEVASQHFLTEVEKDPLGISKVVSLIWLYKGNDSFQSPLTFTHPLWIVESFQDLFNQILELDANSVQFKNLENQIRLIEEQKSFNISDDEKKVVQYAQYFLLKLISAKRSDPNQITILRNGLGNKGKLSKIAGPRFKNSRIYCQNRMSNVLLEKNFDKIVLWNSDRALEKIVTIQDRLERELRKEYAGTTPEEFDLYIMDPAKYAAEHKDRYDLRSVIKHAEKFIRHWKSQNKDELEFHSDFTKFLLNEIYGSDGARSLETLNKALELIEGFNITQPLQKMAQLPPPVIPPAETYRSKYGVLLEAHEPVISQTVIEALEKEILTRSAPLTLKKIETPADKIHTIIGDKQVGSFKQYFILGSIPPKPIKEEVFDDLARSSEQAFVRMANENRNDMRAYVEDRNNVSISKEKAQALSSGINDELQKTENEKEVLKRDLLQFVERFSTPAGISAMRRLVGKDVKPTLDFLISLWRREGLTQPWNDNILKQLGMNEIPKELLHQLDRDIARYLELSIKQKHLTSVLETAFAYIKSCGDAKNAVGDLNLAEGLYNSIETKQYFTTDPSDSPDFRDLLFIEYSQEIVLRKGQVTTLRDMLSDPNAVRQLQMGGGKSKVLLPILAQRKATGKNLVMLMLPEELYETNCRDLDNTNRQLFGQEMHRFDFNRSTDRSKEALEILYARLLETVRDKGFVMTTKRSMLSFRNAYIDLLNQLSLKSGEGNKDQCKILIEQIRQMSKILKLFQEKTDVIADEVDACLDVRKEVNFSIGENHNLQRIKADIGTFLMDIILASKPDDPLYEMAEALKKNTQAAISPEKRKQMMQHLVEKAYQKLKTDLKDVSEVAFVKYIMNQTEDHSTEKWVLALKESNRKLFKVITTIKAFIDRGFGTTLGRIGNVNYGRDPVSGIWTIPYKASNTPHVGSEFDDEIEQISFTIQDYIQNGVTYKQVYQTVARLRNRALTELRASDPDKMLTLNDTAAAGELEDFIKTIDPENKFSSQITLATINNPLNIETLISAINSTNTGRMSYCYHEVLRNIKQYDLQINSLSSDVVDIVKSFGGFTGTPWNLHTYHDKIHAEKNLGVDGLTWSLILGRSIEIKPFTFDAAKPIDSLLTNLDIVGNYQAVIDTGAYLRGTNNRDFIDRTLEVAKEKGKKVSAGIYFDETGKIVKKQAVDQKPLPIEVAPATDLMTTMTLYDQAHTVGADIKQGRRAKAIVTIGENTFIRDLFQAVWRLRQLNQEQNVVFAVSDKIKERILGGDKRELKTEDILKFCQMNEARREAEDNFRAENEKIQCHTKRVALPYIVDIALDNSRDEDLIQIAQKLVSEKEGMFIKARSEQGTYDQYATLKTLQSPLDIINESKKTEESKCAAAATAVSKIDPKLSVLLASKAKDITSRPNIPSDWCPNKVESGLKEGAEVEQQVQAEKEQELELELNTQTQQEQEVQAEIIIPIVQTGYGGTGDVKPLTSTEISSLVQTDDLDTDYLRQLSRTLDFFDPEIYCSAVFERNLQISGPHPSSQSVFYSSRKPVKNVLIVKQDDKWKMIVPTIHEAHGGCLDYINSQNLNNKPSEAVEVALSTSKPLVIYKTGNNRTDALPFKTKADRDHFYRLYVQAKLFNGEIDYATEEEKEALKNWLTSIGPEKFQRYFEQNILPAKPRRYVDAYQKSSLYKIMSELSKTVPKVAA